MTDLEKIQDFWAWAAQECGDCESAVLLPLWGQLVDSLLLLEVGLTGASLEAADLRSEDDE